MDADVLVRLILGEPGIVVRTPEREMVGRKVAIGVLRGEIDEDTLSVELDSGKPPVLAIDKDSVDEIAVQATIARLCHHDTRPAHRCHAERMPAGVDVVDFPEPVGPVTSTMPCGRSMSCLNVP